MRARAFKSARARAHVGLAVALMLVAVAGPAPAQDSPMPHTQVEFRVDALVARTPGTALAVGANAPFGIYLRAGIVVSAGSRWDADGSHGLVRTELTSRYLLDPFRELRWGVYGGAGLAAEWNLDAGARADLLLLAGLEGPPVRGWCSALEVALGGGVRLSVALRRARRNGR